MEDFDDRRLDSVIAEYLERVDRGEEVDRHELLARYPQLADGLRAFFEDSDEIERLAGVIPSRRDSNEPPPRSGRETDRAQGDQSGDAQESPGGRLPFEVPFQPPARYEIVRRLGKGGMGAVYLAHDKYLNRHVAFKVPHANALGDAERITRFLVEARLAATLHHPNICQIFDVGQLEGALQGIPYITMAYIDGKTLAQSIAEGGPLPPRKGAELVIRLARTLHEAHLAGVVHRDLKPANIMIDHRQEPIITDFGLAMQLNQSPTDRLTQDGRLMGTPAYMSPEQLAGIPSQIGAATDIYSLGVLLFELLSGRLPFEGSREAIIAHVLRDTPPNLCDVRSSVPGQLAEICQRMMTREPRDRFPDMQSVVQALEAFLKMEASTDDSRKETSVAAPQGLLSPPVDTVPAAAADTDRLTQAPAKPYRRPKTLAALAAGLLLALLGWNWLAPAPAGGTRVLADDTVPSGLELRIDEEPITIGAQGVLRRFTNGPHVWSIHRGDDLVRTEDFFVTPDGPAVVTLTLKETPIEETRPPPEVPPSKPVLLRTLAGGDSRISALALWPKSARLAVAEELSIGLFDYRTGRSAGKIPLPKDALVGALRFDPTGKRLAVGTATHTWFANFTDVATDRSPGLTDSTEPGATTLAYSIDGRWLASALRGQNVRLVNLAGETEPPLLKGENADAYLVAFHPAGELLVTAHRPAELRWWDLKTGARRLSRESTAKRISSLAFSPDGATLAVGESGGGVILRDSRSGDVSKELIGHGGDVASVSFHPSGRFIASGSDDHTVRIWDLPTGAELHRLHQRDAVESVAFSEEGDLLIAAAGAAVPVWQLPAAMLRAPGPGLIATLEDHRGTVETVDFSPDGRWLLSAGGNSTDFENRADPNIRLWEVRSGALLHVFESRLDRVQKARFSADGNLIVAMSPRGLFEIWDVAKKQLAHDFDGTGSGPVGKGPAKNFDRMRHRQQIVVVGAEGHAIVRLSDLKVTSHWKSRGEGIGAVATWFDGRSPWLVSGSLTGDTVDVWNASLVQSNGRLKASGNIVRFLDVSSDGRYALCGTMAGFTLYDLTSRTVLHSWDRIRPGGPSYDRWIGALSPDGARVLLTTQSSPPALVVIDAASGEPIHEFQGHGSSEIPAVAVSSDGELAASGGPDGKVKLWRLPERSDSDRRAAEWVLSLGGRVEIRDARNSFQVKGVGTLEELPAGPFECVLVQLDNIGSITDTGLKNLAGLKGLEELSLTGVSITDEGLGQLNGLPRLRKLLLDGTQITDRGVGHLRRLGALQQLSLKDTAITGSTFSTLIGAMPLRVLVLAHTPVTDDALRWLQGFPQLEDLYLGNSQVTDRGLEHLWQVKSLRLVDYHFSNVTESGARKLKQALPNLKFVPAE